MTTTTRKRRLWTTQRQILTNTAASVGVVGQESFDLGAAFETASGQQLTQGVTVAHTYIRGILHQDAATTAVNLMWALGLGIFTSGIDDADFPDVASHAGDWLLHEAKIIQEPTSGTINPYSVNGSGSNNGGVVRLESRGQRKILRRDETLWVVIQKDTVTEQDMVSDLVFTVLWLF